MMQNNFLLISLVLKYAITVFFKVILLVFQALSVAFVNFQNYKRKKKGQKAQGHLTSFSRKFYKLFHELLATSAT